MLTLDKTTLYYYFLSDDSTSNKRKFSAGINEWAESIVNASKPTSKASKSNKSLKSSKSSSRSASVLPLSTNVSSRPSADSVLTKNITISQAVPAPIKVETNDHDGAILIVDGGISDEDETKGFERDAAVASPPKGKKRVTSTVSNINISALDLSLIVTA
jgi:hypothetical protein